MALIDLLLDLDDDLFKRVEFKAKAAGLSMEEWVGGCLMASVGETYSALSVKEQAEVRPIVHLDLRTR